MKNKVIKCLSCGGVLDIGENISQCKCSYCGSVNLFKKEGKVELLDVNTVLKKGGRYEGNGNDGKAMELYDNFLQANPNEPLVLLARALISLIDSPNDDFNMELFETYFNKGINAAKDKKMDALDFLMYQFRKYTIPSMCVWQSYAYDKLKETDRRAAKKRMASNMLLLFEIQNRISELVENATFEKLSKSYIEEYKEFQNSIVKFGNDLLEYTELYGLRYGLSNRIAINRSIEDAKRRYRQFTKKYGK